MTVLFYTLSSSTPLLSKYSTLSVVFVSFNSVHCQSWLHVPQTTGLYSAPSFGHISIYIKTLWFYNLVGVLTGNVEEKRFDQEMESKEEEDQEMEGKEKDYEEMESKEEVESQAQDSQEPVLDLQPTLDPDSFDE